MRAAASPQYRPHGGIGAGMSLRTMWVAAQDNVLAAESPRPVDLVPVRAMLVLVAVAVARVARFAGVAVARAEGLELGAQQLRCATSLYAPTIMQRLDVPVPARDLVVPCP